MIYIYRTVRLGTNDDLIGQNISIVTHTGEWDFVQAVWNGETVIGIFRKNARNK